MTWSITGGSAYGTKDIANKIMTKLKFNQPKDQAGFRSGYSTIDLIHTINQVTEKCSEYSQPLFITFIYYEKAFDSVEISAVMQTLRNEGFDKAYINIQEETATIVLHKKATEYQSRRVWDERYDLPNAIYRAFAGGFQRPRVGRVRDMR